MIFFLKCTIIYFIKMLTFLSKLKNFNIKDAFLIKFTYTHDWEECDVNFLFYFFK